MRKRRVHELMNPHVVCARPKMTVGDVQRLLAEHNVSGAPVVDDQGRALGIVSQSDLVRHALEHTTAGEAGLFFSDDEAYEDVGRLSVDRTVTPVEQIMSTEVLCVNPEDGVAVAANIMRERKVHRLIVTEGGAVVGVVTSLDLMRVVEENV